MATITTADEAGLIPSCLATLNDWKVATSELMKKTAADLADKVNEEEAKQIKTNVIIALERMNKKMAKLKVIVRGTQLDAVELIRLGNLENLIALWGQMEKLVLGSSEQLFKDF
jgi:hypothetical protein